VPTWFRRWASGGHDRDKPPTDGGGTLVAVTPGDARSGYVIEVEGGRSFVAQPWELGTPIRRLIPGPILSLAEHSVFARNWSIGTWARRRFLTRWVCQPAGVGG